MRSEVLVATKQDLGNTPRVAKGSIVLCTLLTDHSPQPIWSDKGHCITREVNNKVANNSLSRTSAVPGVGAIDGEMDVLVY